MPSLNDRQLVILERAEQQGFVTIDQLTGTFAVSAQTIRRDIISLDRMGLLQRFHGGAGPIPRSEEMRLGHSRKTQIDVQAKNRIAQLAADVVPEGSSIFIDVGTTMEATAQALDARAGYTVFTNNVRAACLFDHTRHAVHVLPGQLSGKDGSLTGATLVMTLSDLKLDFALIGCSAVEQSGRVMDFDLEKIAVKKCAMRVAAKSFLLVAKRKFNRSAAVAIGRTSDFARVITEH